LNRDDSAETSCPRSSENGATLLGAVGVSGDTSDNDEICAIAGIEAAGLKANPG
jgi:Haem-degrading